VYCGGNCIDPTTNPSFCGASGNCSAGNAGTTCRYDEVCKSSSCSATLGPYSYLSPGVGLTTQGRARTTKYEIGTPYPATIYYTTDGSTPVEGATATKSGASPLNLGVLASGATILWFADFGSPLGKEPVVHTLNFTVAASGQDSHGQIVEGLSFTGGLGPVISVAAGATVSGSANVQFWHSDSTGYCPSCDVFFSLWLDSEGASQYCSNNYATWTGTSAAPTFSFTAPTKPGRYAMRANNALDYQCDPGGEEIGEVFVY
jgi:hypothetical protein